MQACRTGVFRAFSAVWLKNGGTGIPPVKLDLHHQIRCLSDYTTPFLLNKQNPEHTAEFQAVCSGFYCLDWRS